MRLKGEIPIITNLVISNLVKKTDYKTKINEIEKKITDHNHDKNITTPEFNKFITKICDLRLKRENLASKSDIANFVNKTDSDNELKDVKRNKNELNELSKKVKLIPSKELTKYLVDKLSILNGKKYFSLGIFPNYFNSKKYIKYFSGTTRIESWKSNRMPEESIENITKSVSNFSPNFVDHHLLTDMNFNETV